MTMDHPEPAEPASVLSAFFDVYGFQFELRSSCRSAFDGLCQDFAFFRSESRQGDRVLEIVLDSPGYENLPPLDAAIHTPRNIVYKDDKESLIDYHGRGIATHDRASGSFLVRSLDPDILYESAYLYLLSQCGEFLDAKGMHRVHALCISIRDRAVLVVLPMGGGKSTLAHDLLKHPQVKLLSDDSPLVDRAGNIHAYPLRIGLLPGSEGEVPEEHRRVIQRMGFGPKVSVSYEYFADRVAGQAEPGIVFFGTRSLSTDCRMERAGLFYGMRSLFSNCVVGLGLFQGVEFVLNRRITEMIPLIGVAASRLWSSWRLLRRSHVHHLRLGRNRELNSRMVVEQSERLFGNAREQSASTVTVRSVE